MKLADWDSWDPSIHSDPAQIKRQKNAAKFETSPISIGDEFATFRGSKKDYHTTLLSCNCADFGMRKLPCKHMYRLAYEIGIFHLDGVKHDDKISERLRIDDVMPLVEALPDYIQKDLKSVLYNSHFDGYAYLDSSEAKILKDAGLFIDYPDRSIYLKKFKKNELLSLVDGFDTDGEVTLKLKKPEIIELILKKFPDICEASLENSGIALIAPSDKIKDIDMKIHHRLCQKFPYEDAGMSFFR